MILGIDASNIRTGGGLTHLQGILSKVRPQDYGFQQIKVWAGKHTLAHLPDLPCLTRHHVPLLDRSLPFRWYWRWWVFPKLIHQECDVLFVPGGSFFGKFTPMVTMAQNLLPFDLREIRRYGFKRRALRLLLLRYLQSKTFKQAESVIHLTHFAKKQVADTVKADFSSHPVIPHGLEPRWFQLPRPQALPATFSEKQPFRLLYVSTIDRYKNHDTLLEAIARLRKEGIPMVIDLIGGIYAPAYKRLKKVIQRLDPKQAFIFYHHEVPYGEITHYYHTANAFVFASSCETFGQALLEAMASGLPIACADSSASPEVLKEAGIYFKTNDSQAIANALHSLFNDANLRERLSKKAYDYAKAYSWESCADATFTLLSNVKTKE